jgi:thiosulfate dehydrogenase [quinone] large subunit
VVAPEIGIAILRVVVGVWFLKAVWTKLGLVWMGPLPYPEVTPRFLGFHPRRVGEFAEGNPVGWYKEFLEGTVLPNATLFATLQAYGEVVVGIGLVLGLFTSLAALVGLFLAINYGLATQWMSPGQQGFHLVLFFLMLAFFFARAGRTWGLDGWLARRKPNSLLSRRPFS